MFPRILLLALIALVVAVPSAGATTIGDKFVPVHDASDGVTVGVGKSKVPFLRFAPKAAKLYKQVAGKRTVVACGQVAVEHVGRVEIGGVGHDTTTVRLPRKRGRIPLETSGGADVCTLSTRLEKNEDEDCLRNSTDEKRYCVRVIVPLTDAGRKRLDGLARSAELLLVIFAVGFADPDKPALPQVQELLGPDAVELAAPDAVPPAGKIGFWSHGLNYGGAVLLADGSRRFVTFQDGVLTTNDPAFMGLDEDAYAIFP